MDLIIFKRHVSTGISWLDIVLDVIYWFLTMQNMDLAHLTRSAL